MQKNKYLTLTKHYAAKVVFLLGLCLCNPLVSAQSLVTLTLDNADIFDLVKWAQDVTPKTIIVHPSVKGRVTVIAGDPMSRGEAYQVFLSVLEMHGFGVVETPRSIKILPNSQTNRFAIPVSPGDKNSRPEDIVIRILKVDNVSSRELVSLLKPLIPKDAYIVAYPATNSIIVADRVGNIKKILTLINKIDRVGVVDIDFIPIEFASAKDVVSIINSLMQQSKSGDNQGLKIAVDERSNSILITGDPASRQQIKNLVARLDKPLPGEGNTQVIYLDYAEARELVPILQSMSGSIQKNDKDREFSNVEVNIQSSETHNALIITAPSSLLSTMKGVIKELDIRRSQVLVEALIVEVNEDINSNFGIDWSVPARIGKEMLVGGFSSFPSNVSPLSVNENGSLSLGSGFSVGYMRGGDLLSVISALKGNANANVLSTPTILTLDNEEAKILVGENVPFVTGSEKRQGDSAPFQTIERQDIGVSLTVKPRINNDNSVTLEIHQTVESIGQTDVETADIITNKREIKTKVLVGNGETLVLGGLMRDELVESESRVPILSKIPLLGRLFRSTSTTTVKRNLMVFIRPQIITNAAAGADMSRERYDFMQNKQLEFRDRINSYFIEGDAPKLEDLPSAKADTINPVAEVSKIAEVKKTVTRKRRYKK